MITLFFTACTAEIAIEAFVAGAAAGITLLTVGSRTRRRKGKK